MKNRKVIGSGRGICFAGGLRKGRGGGGGLRWVERPKDRCTEIGRLGTEEWWRGGLVYRRERKGWSGRGERG